MEDLKRILVPLDGSILSEKALPLAVTLAQKFKGKIILIRVVDFLRPTLIAPHLTTATATSTATAYEHSCRDAHLYLLGKRKVLSEQGLDVETVLRDTAPAEAIINTAKDYQVDCIVMSTHGRSGIIRMTLGSVADAVVHQAPCPVLLVRQKPNGSNHAVTKVLARLLFRSEAEEDVKELV